jgi:hypothetical protein
MNYLSLFGLSFIQVFFVSLNTIFLSESNYIGVMFAAFSISYIWTLNVKRLSVGTNFERFIYSIGAMSGSLSGLFITKMF